jgi:hypothetical protein
MVDCKFFRKWGLHTRSIPEIALFETAYFAMYEGTEKPDFAISARCPQCKHWEGLDLFMEQGL